MEKRRTIDEAKILYFTFDHSNKENTGVGSNLAAPAQGPRVSTEGWWVAGVGRGAPLVQGAGLGPGRACPLHPPPH